MQPSRERQSPRARRDIGYTPKWEDVERWAILHATRNAWRVPDLEIEDLMQEAWIKFAQCVRQYPHVIEPQHFFSLFKISFVNHMHTLARKRRVDMSSVAIEKFEESGVVPDALCDSPEGELVVLLQEARPSMREFILRVVAGWDPADHHMVNRTKRYLRTLGT